MQTDTEDFERVCRRIVEGVGFGVLPAEVVQATQTVSAQLKEMLMRARFPEVAVILGTRQILKALDRLPSCDARIKAAWAAIDLPRFHSILKVVTDQLGGGEGTAEPRRREVEPRLWSSLRSRLSSSGVEERLVALRMACRLMKVQEEGSRERGVPFEELCEFLVEREPSSL